MPLFRRILIISEQILKNITYFLSKYNPFKSNWLKLCEDNYQLGI